MDFQKIGTKGTRLAGLFLSAGVAVMATQSAEARFDSPDVQLWATQMAGSFHSKGPMGGFVHDKGPHGRGYDEFNPGMGIKAVIGMHGLEQTLNLRSGVRAYFELGVFDNSGPSNRINTPYISTGIELPLVNFKMLDNDLRVHATFGAAAAFYPAHDRTVVNGKTYDFGGLYFSRYAGLKPVENIYRTTGALPYLLIGAGVVVNDQVQIDFMATPTLGNSVYAVKLNYILGDDLQKSRRTSSRQSYGLKF